MKLIIFNEMFAPEAPATYVFIFLLLFALGAFRIKEIINKKTIGEKKEPPLE